MIDERDALFEGLAGREHQVWMSHGDRVETIPPALAAIAHSDNSPYAAVRTRDGLLRGIQFHPEVAHTPCGSAGAAATSCSRSAASRATGRMAAFVETKLAEIRDARRRATIAC